MLFFLIGVFHDAIAPASVKLIYLSLAEPQIISPREHRAEQHDNLCGCDQRAFLGLPEKFKEPLEMENSQHTDTKSLGA